MGYIIKTNNHFEYRQDSGETTAWFDLLEEKMELGHKGDPQHKKIFYILIGLGLLYLIIIFTFVH